VVHLLIVPVMARSCLCKYIKCSPYDGHNTLMFICEFVSWKVWSIKEIDKLDIIWIGKCNDLPNLTSVIYTACPHLKQVREGIIQLLVDNEELIQDQVLATSAVETLLLVQESTQQLPTNTKVCMCSSWYVSDRIFKFHLRHI